MTKSIPAQTSVGFGEINAVGLPFTVTVILSVPWQELSSVTVYVRT